MDSIIPFGQKNTLVEYMILSGADNCPPMLDKDLVSKDLWERVQLLMQGTSLTKQEREYKLYDAFDMFAHIKGESLHNLPLEWSKFVTDIKLVKDLHTTNYDQLDAYLEQHELHANEGRPNSYAAGTSGTGGNYSGQQRVVMCFNCQGEGHMARQCPKPKRKRDATWFRDKVLLVEAQGNGKVLNEEELEFLADPGIAEAKDVLMANLYSYGSNVLSEVPHSYNTHNDMLNKIVQEM
ncbi:retrovirus-related pol polyprotein from transposon TNT 1-94 [Tanacetum coccineum]